MRAQKSGASGWCDTSCTGNRNREGRKHGVCSPWLLTFDQLMCGGV
jgi:hypothetical protein